MLNKNKIAVLGAGTMGAGMVTTYAAGGYEVCVYSRTQKTLDRAAKVIASSFDLLVEENMIAKEAAEAAIKNITYTTSVEEAVQDAWYVAETVVEVEEVKTELYAQLDKILPEEVIIASDTSAMNIFNFMPAARQPHTVIAHFYAPAYILPLVEVVKGPETLEWVMDATMELHKKCGKTTIRMERFISGFIVNRLQSGLGKEVTFLLEEGYCTPEDIDLAVKTSLMPRGLLLGLIQRMDFTGMNVVVDGYYNKTYTPTPPYKGVPSYIQKVYDRGDLGVKTGRGFFDYSGQSYEDILRHRDKQLLKSVRLASEFMADPLETVKKD